MPWGSRVTGSCCRWRMFPGPALLRCLRWPYLALPLNGEVPPRRHRDDRARCGEHRRAGWDSCEPDLTGFHWGTARTRIISYRVFTAESEFGRVAAILLAVASRFRFTAPGFGRGPTELPAGAAAVAYGLVKTTGPGRVSAVTGGPAISAPCRRPASIGSPICGASVGAFSHCTR